MADTRYQHQTWLVRRWRDRWLLLVPYRALRIWLRKGIGGRLPFATAWSIALGYCDCRRNWVYTWAEVEAMLRK